MKSLLQHTEYEYDETPQDSAPRQALSMFLHTLLALGTWLGLMLIGYAVNPKGVPQWAILLLSMAVPLLGGLIAARVHPDEMATMVWLIGAIWVMIFCLYVLDLPTAPGHCLECGANEKLARTFLSFPSPSGLIDNDAPFLATWPAAALIGYSIGAKLGMSRKR